MDSLPSDCISTLLNSLNEKHLVIVSFVSREMRSNVLSYMRDHFTEDIQFAMKSMCIPIRLTGTMSTNRCMRFAKYWHLPYALSMRRYSCIRCSKNKSRTVAGRCDSCTGTCIGTTTRNVLCKMKTCSLYCSYHRNKCMQLKGCVRVVV